MPKTPLRDKDLCVPVSLSAFGKALTVRDLMNSSNTPPHPGRLSRKEQISLALHFFAAQNGSCSYFSLEGVRISEEIERDGKHAARLVSIAIEYAGIYYEKGQHARYERRFAPD